MRKSPENEEKERFWSAIKLSKIRGGAGITVDGKLYSDEELKKIHISSASTKSFLNKISYSNIKSKIINFFVGIRDF